jgi:hypothetical protein
MEFSGLPTIALETSERGECFSAKGSDGINGCGRELRSLRLIRDLSWTFKSLLRLAPSASFCSQKDTGREETRGRMQRKVDESKKKEGLNERLNKLSKSRVEKRYVCNLGGVTDVMKIPQGSTDFLLAAEIRI